MCRVLMEVDIGHRKKHYTSITILANKVHMHVLIIKCMF